MHDFYISSGIQMIALHSLFQGARTQCLVLSNLEVGDYTFQLTVTDDAGQEDTAKVTIIVQPVSSILHL